MKKLGSILAVGKSSPPKLNHVTEHQKAGTLSNGETRKVTRRAFPVNKTATPLFYTTNTPIPPLVF